MSDLPIAPEELGGTGWNAPPVDPTITPKTAEELMYEGVPTAEELMAPPKNAVIGGKNWLNALPGLNLLLAPEGQTFIKGAERVIAPEEGFGLTSEDRERLESTGFGSLLKGAETSIGQSAQMIGRSLLYGPAALADLTVRTQMGILYGVGDVLIEKGVHRDILGMALETFPAGHATGFPHSPLPLTREAQIRRWTRDVPERNITNLDSAAEAGVIPGVDPLAAMKENQKNPESLAVPSAPPERTIHDVAREIAPEIMTQYETDTARADTIRTELDRLNQIKLNDPNFQTIVDSIRKQGRETDALKLETTDTAEMVPLREELHDTTRRMDRYQPAVKEAYAKANERMAATPPMPPTPISPPADAEILPPKEVVTRDSLTADFTDASGNVDVPGAITATATKVERALRDGTEVTLYDEGKPRHVKAIEGDELVFDDGQRQKLGQIALDGEGKTRLELEPRATKRAEVIGFDEIVASADGEIGSSRGITKANVALVDKVKTALVDGAEVKVTIGGKDIAVKSIDRNMLVLDDGQRTSAATLARSPQDKVTIFNQTSRSIAKIIEGRLLDVGRPAEEAAAGGRLSQAYYRSVAAMFEGKLGSAEDIFQSKAPWIRAGQVRNPLVQGRTIISRVRRTVELMKSADASTFPHEMAHNWLQDIREFVEHPEAPAALKTDWDTIKKGYGLPENYGPAQWETFQEKFARGFEKYLFEGRAPTKALVPVFTKFSKWLKDIYGAVTGIVGRNLTDELRGVYGRLLDEGRREAIVAPDKLRMGEAHEAAAATATLDEATRASNTMAAERAENAAAVGKEIDDGRRDARSGPEGDGVLPEPFNKADAAEKEGGGEPTVTLDAGRDIPKAETPETAGQSSPFSQPDGTPIPGNINTEGDFAEAIRSRAASTGVKRNLTDTERLNIARETGLPGHQIDGISIGKVWTPEQVTAATEIIREQLNTVQRTEAAVDAIVGDKNWSTVAMSDVRSPEAIKAIAEYAIEKQRFQLMTDTLVSTASNMGSAFRLLRFAKYLTTYEDALEFFQKQLNTTPEGLAKEATIAKRVVDPAQHAKLLQRTGTFAGNTVRGVMEFFLSSIFSGFVTQGVNIIGNTLTFVTNIGDVAGARGISMLRRDQSIVAGEVKDIFTSLKPGAIQGVIGAGRVLTDEGYAYREAAPRPVDIPRAPGQHGAIPNFRIPFPFMDNGLSIPLGTILRYPSFRLLAASDEFFKSVAETEMLHRVARRKAVGEGIIDVADLNARQAALIANPTEGMLAVAADHRNYQTFTQRLGPFGRSLQTLAQVHPTMALIFSVVKTGTNLTKYALQDRTVLGLVSKEYRKVLFDSSPEMRVDQNMAISRQAMGNTVLVGAMIAAAEGLITGGGPKDAGERETNRLNGISPYSVYTPFGSFSYQAFMPWAWHLMFAADAVEFVQHMWDPTYEDMSIDEKEKLTEELGVRASLMVQRDFFDVLPLRGAANLFEAVYGYSIHGGAYERNMLGGFIPNLFGQTAQITDPFVRENRSFMDTLRYKMPGLRTGLPARIDRWGQPTPNRALGAIRWNSATNDPVDQAMLRLDMNNAPPARTIDHIQLTAEQYEQYATLSGQMAKRWLDAIVQPGFENIPAVQQRKMIGSTIKRARDIARGIVTQQSLGQGDHDIIHRKYLNELKALQP